MEIGAAEVDDALASQVLDPRVADIPFSRHRPIEHPRSGRHLVDVNGMGHMTLYPTKRLPNAVSRDTSTNRIQLRHEVVEFFANARGGRTLVTAGLGLHRTATSVEAKSGYDRSRPEITRTASGQRISNLLSFHRNPRPAL